MFMGFTGGAFTQDNTLEVTAGKSFRIGRYQVKVADIQNGEAENGNYAWSRAKVEVSKDGQSLGTMQPEKRFYKSSREQTSEIALRRRLSEDFYLNFSGVSKA